MKKLTTILLFLPLIWASCKKERPSLDPPGSKVDGIRDEWVLFQVKQFDEITENELDVSSVYIGNDPMKIEFKIENTDTLYSVTEGSSLNYLGSNGNWRFDNNEFPEKLIVNFDGNDIFLKLNRTVRPTDQTLEFKFSKVCHGRRVVSYNYVFKRS
ncbi:MAG: DUF5004 domain-containing protein [Flavobacteriales bacterium]|nr:DUF5004 domain-containing protein [Flavobacteriales bacterium]